MKRVLVLLVLAFVVPCLAEEVKPAELTGILRKNTFKDDTPYKLELDGGTGFIGLSGDRLLRHIPFGTRIWVSGHIDTYLYVVGKEDPAKLSQRTHWQIYMAAKECTVIAKPFEIARDTVLQNKSMVQPR